MKAKMRDRLVARYRKFLPGELEATENGDGMILFLESIEGERD